MFDTVRVVYVVFEREAREFQLFHSFMFQLYRSLQECHSYHSLITARKSFKSILEHILDEYLTCASRSNTGTNRTFDSRAGCSARSCHTRVETCLSRITPSSRIVSMYRMCVLLCTVQPKCGIARVWTERGMCGEIMSKKFILWKRATKSTNHVRHMRLPWCRM